ncbi:MAG: hypothetical protein JNL82_25165 [Myxococcales bacterium]|nr:hypothetical protein [Myxococcales bacterium]
MKIFVCELVVGAGIAAVGATIDLRHAGDRRHDARADCEAERAAFTWRDALGSVNVLSDRSASEDSGSAFAVRTRREPVALQLIRMWE